MATRTGRSKRLSWRPKRKRMRFASKARPKQKENTRKTVIALVSQHKESESTKRETALSRALKRKSSRSRRVVFESSVAGPRSKRVRRFRPSKGRRGNPGKSYSPGLSRGLPGNEESDP
jgi:hypothetical protein